jgi:hypothetical protein
LGLLALGQSQPLATEEGEYRTDRAELTLYPAEWVEYFYRLDQGSNMVFTWEATGPVTYNFHASPDGAPAGYAESFDAQDRADGHGTYTAPFTGIRLVLGKRRDGEDYAHADHVGVLHQCPGR